MSGPTDSVVFEKNLSCDVVEGGKLNMCETLPQKGLRGN